MGKDEVFFCICDLEHCFLWCLVSNEEYSSTWPLDFYWAVTISIDKNCGRVFFLVSKQWLVDIQRHDITPCSWVNLTVKIMYLYIELCWHQQGLDVAVVFLLVETLDLYCLHIVECCFRDSTLRSWLIICCLLLWSCTLLMCLWSHYSLCTQFMDFCRL